MIASWIAKIRSSKPSRKPRDERADCRDVYDEEFTGAKANAKYYDEFRAKIAAVDKAAVQAVAKKYLVPGKVVVLIVGDKDEILKGHPDHPVKLADLSPGGLIELPLRDPFTLKPLE